MKNTTNITTLFLVLGLILVPAIAFAGFGLGETAGAAGLDGYGSSVPAILGTIIGSVLSLIGIVFFILVVYGGFMWMTAGGNQDTVKKAINTVVSAAIGLVVVLAAYAITTFALNAIGGSAVAGGGGGGGGRAGTLPGTEDIGDTTTTCGSVECTAQQQCVGDVCIDNCIIDDGSGVPMDATCMARSACDGEIETGLCPGGSDWVCCVE